jgi:katanin p80 WD40 repeat-containing subunit B1
MALTYVVQLSWTLQSLTGLTSPVESVSFDSSEVTIGAGAASGTIKIWDVEEAKGMN